MRLRDDLPVPVFQQASTARLMTRALDDDLDRPWPEITATWSRLQAAFRSARESNDAAGVAAIVAETRRQLADVAQGGWRWLYWVLTNSSTHVEPGKSLVDFAVAILRDAGPHVPQVLPRLVRAAVDDPDPSFNRRHVEPALYAFGPRRVTEALLAYLEQGNAYEKAGAARALYWAETLVNPGSMRPAPQPGSLRSAATYAELSDLWQWKRDLRLRLVEEFVTTTDPRAQRALVTEMDFEAAAYPEHLQSVRARAIEIARTHPDPFVQRWVEAALRPTYVLVDLPGGPTTARVFPSRGEAPTPPSRDNAQKPQDPTDRL